MEINETLIKEYAKKILGFAYSKTRNHSEAQDLSQDILLQLCRIDFTSKNIENMDGYIYRVCQYTWSNFVRKNISAWNTAEYDELSAVASGETPDGDVIRSELYARLRQEIMYLGKDKRDAVVLFYYEGKNGSKISQILNVPASTVRWYLSESRKILKERIEMVEGIYSPIRLKVFYNGSCNESTMAGLGADLLVENICIVCAKKALSIEEIARTMGMSAAFIENKLDGLLNMNYIEKTGAGKYRTTFYIKDRDFIFVQKKYEMEHIPPVADAIYHAVYKNLGAIRSIGFNGCDLDDNILLWDFVTVAAHDYLCKNEMQCEYEPPMRGDGSRHWLDVSWSDEALFQEDICVDKDLADYIRSSGGCAGRHTGNNKITMQQFDPAITGGRNGWFSSQLSTLERIYKLSREMMLPNDFEKELIAQFTADGFVTVINGRPKIMIPYFTREEFTAFRNIMDNEVIPSAEAEAGTMLAVNYGNFIEGYIPSYLPKEEKAFVRSRFYVPNAFTYLLMKSGKLTMPREEECKRICSIVWER